MTTYQLQQTASAFEFSQVFNDREFVDSSGALYQESRGGSRFRFTLSFSNLTGEDAQDLMGYVALLRGRQHRAGVTMNRLGYVARGAYGGSPVTSGIEAVGQTVINLSGASTSITKWAAQGDFVALGNQLRIVTEDANSDGGGNVSISVWPEVHVEVAASTALQTTAATVGGVFYLVEANGLGSVPWGDGWHMPSVTLVIEQDITEA